ncbi:MAG TPA: alpha-L-fucosidase, partial [Vicinamibacteria bacterium]
PPLPWGRCTRKASASGDTLYLHVFDWPADGKLVVPGIKGPVDSARLLAGGPALEVLAPGDGVVIKLPAKAPDALSSTIALKLTTGSKARIHEDTNTRAHR